MKIKKFEFFIILLKMYLKKNNKKIIKNKDNKKTLTELFILVIINIIGKYLPINNKLFANKIIYNEV